MRTLVLQGRAAELAELEAHAAAAREGSGRLVAAVGPAGIGKTALVAAACCGAAGQGLRVLRARGTEAEQALPYGVIRQLLEGPAGEAAASTDGAAARGRAFVRGEAGAAGGDDFVKLHAIFWFVSELAAREPLALVVDDLHWADVSSLRALDYLRVRVVDLPVLLLVAARVLPMAEWSADAGAEHITVGPLGEADVAALVADTFGPAPQALVAACAEVTGGNPFLLRELLRELLRAHDGAATDPGTVRTLVPARIVDATAARLVAMGGAAGRLAQAVATLGDDAQLGRAAALAELSGAVAAQAADELAAAGILASGRPLRFTHPLLLSAVRETIAPRDMSHLHVVAARLAQGEPGGLATACTHLLHVDPAGDAEVVEVLRRGAAHAMASGTSDTAVALLRRARAEPPPPEQVAPLLAELAMAASSAQEPDAIELVTNAMSIAADPVSRALCAVTAITPLVLAGRADVGVRFLLEAGANPEIGPELTALTGDLAAAGSMMTIAARDVDRPWLARARALAEAPEATLRSRVVGALEAAVGHGTAQQATDLAVAAWSDGRLLREEGTHGPFPHWACWVLALAGETARMERWAQRCIDQAATSGSVFGRVAAITWYAGARESRGDLTSADAYIREAVETAEAFGGLGAQLALSIMVLARIEMAARGPEAAARALERLPPQERDPESITAQFWWLSRAAVALAGDRPDDALADVGAVQAWERRWPAEGGGWATWRPLAALAHHALGDIQTARTIARDGVLRAERFGAPRQLGEALRAAAMTAPEDERAHGLVRAAEVMRRGDCGADHATCLIDLGETLLRSGAVDAALVALHDALTEADSIGADAVAARAQRVLVEAGARPRRAARSGLRSLTPAERRVADLAARALRNREIAERLFLTEKTVEMHLTTVYRKLGIRSRVELAGAGVPSGELEAGVAP